MLSDLLTDTNKVAKASLTDMQMMSQLGMFMTCNYHWMRSIIVIFMLTMNSILSYFRFCTSYIVASYYIAADYPPTCKELGTTIATTRTTVATSLATTICNYTHVRGLLDSAVVRSSGSPQLRSQVSCMPFRYIFCVFLPCSGIPFLQLQSVCAVIGPPDSSSPRRQQRLLIGCTEHSGGG